MGVPKPLLLGFVLLPVGVSAVGTAALYTPHAVIRVDFERAYEAGFASGFHGRERGGQNWFRWTTGASYLDLRHLPRTGVVEVLARLRVIRPSGYALPNLSFTANGVTVHRTRARAGTAEYAFRFPSRSSFLRLGILSDTFEAGGGRSLGVQALSFDLRSTGAHSVALRPVLWMALGSLLIFASAWATGVSPVAAALVSTPFSLGFVHLLAQGATRFTDYPRELALLSVVTLAVSFIMAWAGRRLAWLEPRERPVLAAVAAFTLLLRLASLFHPSFVSSDADFQANRLSELLQGNFHPTSVTQHEPPFRIPYPISLYVVAAPFAGLGLDRVKTLQIVTGVADVAVGIVLVYLACRFLRDFRAGALSAVLYQVVPLNFLAFSAGNLTNLFGVASSSGFLGVLLAASHGGGALPVFALFVFSLLALTSHLGSLLMGLGLWPASLSAVLARAPVVSQRKRAVVGATVASVGVAVVYYAGYRELFVSQWRRALTGDGAPAAEAPLAEWADRLMALHEQLGIVFGLLALAGAAMILTAPARSSFHAAAAAWTTVAILFLAVDLATPLQVRWVLHLLPLLSLFAGYALSRAWKRGNWGRAAAVTGFAYVAAHGLANLRECIFFRYH